MKGSQKTPSRSSGGGAGGLERYAGYGMAWVLAALAGGWAGLWLDGRFGTSPFLAVLGSLGGAATGLYTLYARLLAEPAGKRRDTKE